MTQLAAPPFVTALQERGLLSDPWVKWLTSVWQAINDSAQQVGSVSRTGLLASITTTAIPTPTLTTGLYRLSWYVLISQAASVSSSVTPTFTWTDDGNACTFSPAAITGNTVGTTQGDSITIRSLNGTTVTYATAYASVGATVMKHSFFVTLEALP